MKRVDQMTIEEIEADAENEITFQIFRNQSYIMEITDISEHDFSNTYELIELAPMIFQNIRKMFKVTNGSMKRVFSIKNLRKLQISVTQGKGGSFFIRPSGGHGKVLIKSITIPEYNTLKSFLPEYYSHLLMNPNTYLVPIFGAYKMKLQKSSDVTPIAFIIMRDALDISRYEIGPHDRMYSFDLKGSLHDRQTLSNPLDIFEIDADYDDYKDVIFKDFDFLQSFTKLDITNAQAERILSQLKNDVELLNENDFTDYSLIMHIIIRPYSSVKAPINYVSTRERALFSGSLESIEDVDEELEDDNDEEYKVHSRENKFLTPQVSKDAIQKKRKSHMTPDASESPTYYNRATGRNEILNLFRGTEDDKC
jgi:hypothetical protein